MNVHSGEPLILSPRELIAGIRNLPSLPATYFRVKAILERPDSPFSEVEREISSDAAMTSRLLHLANSALYALQSRLESIGNALSILGLDQVRHLVLVTSVTGAFRGISPDLMDMRRFWMANMLRALLARGIAGKDSRIDADRVFTEGLLGDIGHLVMYMAMPDVARQALVRARETGQPLHRVESELIGFDYAEVGAELLSTWNFSESMEAVVRHHPEPLAAGGSFAVEASILHIATRFADAALNGEPLDGWTRRVDPVIWLEAGLSDEGFEEIQAQAEEEITGLAQSLFPEMNAAHVPAHLQRPRAA
jgi:HD-like signal output (HDOD) protein